MFKKSGSCCVIKCKIENKRLKMIKTIVGISIATVLVSCMISKAKKRINKRTKEEKYINGKVD